MDQIDKEQEDNNNDNNNNDNNDNDNNDSYENNDNNNSNSDNNNNNDDSNNDKVDYTQDLGSMIERVRKEPKPRFIIPGIKQGTLGAIFGPPKSGKTIFCELLGMCIAAGEDTFLGMPIDIDNGPVLFISCEEHFIPRTQRNDKQTERLIKTHGTKWLSNYIVVTDKAPRYVENDEGWKILHGMIDKHKPALVFIDSLTHLCPGVIEESATAIGLMKRLKGLAEEKGTTICVIHHCHKIYDGPLTRDSLAGSRVLAAEFDFLIGINKTGSGKRYIKDIDNRYCQIDSETVREFMIENDYWIVLKGKTTEGKLLSESDGRFDSTNKELILEFMETDNDDKEKVFKTKEFHEALTKDKTMSPQTLHSCLDKLVEEGVIIKLRRGRYKLAA